MQWLDGKSLTPVKNAKPFSLSWKLTINSCNWEMTGNQGYWCMRMEIIICGFHEKIAGLQDLNCMQTVFYISNWRCVVCREGWLDIDELEWNTKTWKWARVGLESDSLAHTVMFLLFLRMLWVAKFSFAWDYRC